jgi:sodium-dependent dicarboxylate transporter 2/3/5
VLCAVRGLGRQTANVVLPILGSIAVAIKQSPLLLMIPGTISCSYAFMLPVATPPNAVIFAYGHFKVRSPPPPPSSTTKT